jgi:predicted permease
MTDDPRRSRLYRALLRLLPSGFRAEFGPDMEQLFADRRREAGSSAARARLWVEAVADVAWQAMGEWSAMARRTARSLVEEGMTMQGWIRDLRFGARTLMRHPGFSLAAIGTLALGIGATVSIFSVVNGVLLTPLPFPEPERLVTVWSMNTRTGERGTTVDHPDVRTWQEEVTGLDVAAYSGSRPTLTGLGPPEVVPAARVTDGLLTLMGYAPALGRDLTAADDVPDGPDVVVISHGFWTDRLGRDPRVVGRSIELAGQPWEVVGVAPPEFDFPAGTELWMPRQHQVGECGHGCRLIRAIGRIRPGATLEEIQANLDAVGARLATDFPDSHRDIGTLLEPMLDTEVADVKTALWVLFGAVGMVLLIACANVANLMLVRGSQRGSEIALRVSLGASRARVLRQLLTESLIIAALAGAGGLALSAWGTSVLVAMAPDSLPRLGEAGLDPTVVGFTILLVLLVTTLFGLLPAAQLSNEALREGVASGTRSGGRRRSGSSRSVLVAGDVALSLALLLGAGLLFRTLVEIRGVDFGFAIEDSERFRVSIPESRYDSLGIVRFIDEMEDRLATIPGLAAVGSGFGVPLASGNIGTSLQLLDRPDVDPADRAGMAIRPASPGFLEASGMRLLAGRWLQESDAYGREGVGVINETAARLHYPDVDPIGRRLRADVSWSFAETPPLTIVGVVGDVRGRAATEDPEPALYLSNAQFGANSIYVWMRLRPGVATVMPEVRAALAELDPDLAITDVATVEEVVAAQQDAPRFYLTLLTVFSALALVLSVIGLYGVVAFSVAQRTREIGIRIALGAEADRVVGMVLGQSVRPIAAGVVLGLMLSLAGARVLESLLFGVQPSDPVTIVLVTSFLIVVSVAATVLPASRAARIEAASALRSE